jgi:hypothetical protein
MMLFLFYYNINVMNEGHSDRKASGGTPRVYFIGSLNQFGIGQERRMGRGYGR